MKHLLVILSIAILPYVVSGQGFKFTATVSKSTIAVGEQFTLTYAANGSISNFNPPKFNNFKILSGPNSSTSMNYANGKMTRRESYAYVLTPLKVGAYKFAAASIKSGGNNYKSNVLTVKVIKSKKKKAANQVTSNNLFLDASTKKRTVYVGEQMPVTYTVYFNLDVAHSETVKLPSFNGFWTENVEVPRQATVYQKTIDNVRYNAADLRKIILFPQRSGNLVLDQMEFKVIVRTRVRKRSWFDPGFKNDEYILKSVPMKIKVKPVPEKGKPESFDGAVGKFVFKVDIDRNELQANEAVTLKIKINGAGNLNLLEQLKFELPPDIETFDPKITDKIKVDISGVSGSRTYEYLLIPRHAGEYIIAPIEFSYFDPAKKKYFTLSSPEFSLNVSKGDEQATTTLSTINKEYVRFIGSDIRYIVDTPFLLFSKGSRFFMSNKFYAAYVSPLLLLFMLLILRRRHVERNKDITQVRRRGANRMAKKSLARSKEHINKNKNQFYQEVLKGLWGYLSMKLSVDVADLSKESIRNSLEERKVSSETIEEIIDVLDTCEFAQYAPDSDEGAMDKVYERAASAISIIESEIS